MALVCFWRHLPWAYKVPSMFALRVKTDLQRTLKVSVHHFKRRKLKCLVEPSNGLLIIQPGIWNAWFKPDHETSFHMAPRQRAVYIWNLAFPHGLSHAASQRGLVSTDSANHDGFSLQAQCQLLGPLEFYMYILILIIITTKTCLWFPHLYKLSE